MKPLIMDNVLVQIFDRLASIKNKHFSEYYSYVCLI